MTTTAPGGHNTRHSTCDVGLAWMDLPLPISSDRTRSCRSNRIKTKKIHFGVIGAEGWGTFAGLKQSS